MPWRKNYVRTRAVPVRPSQGKNSVRQTVGRLKPATPVPVAIRDAERSNSGPGPCRGPEHSKSSEVNMMRSTRMCEHDSLSLSLRRRSGKPSRLVSILILTLLPVVTYAADGLPSSPPAGGRAPDPGAIPEKMIEPGKVPTAPSKSDPGIQHMPEKLGDPRGAVKPPSLDPGISKNPDAGSPASKETNPRGAETPQKKPGVR